MTKLTAEQMADVRREARETFTQLGSKLVDGSPPPLATTPEDGAATPKTSTAKRQPKAKR